jgi:hypothetical protein
MNEKRNTDITLHPFAYLELCMLMRRQNQMNFARKFFNDK